MSEVERVADELARAFDGDAWHGDPLLKILDGVDAEVAAARPIPGAHSIWEIVLHVRAWMVMGARRVVERSPLRMDDTDDWPPVPQPADEGAWAETLSSVHDAQRQLLEAVGGLSEGELHELIGTRDPAQGTGGTYAYLPHGLAQHAAYHAGQVALLKKALRPTPAVR